MKLFKYVKLYSNISAERKNKIVQILSENKLEYKLKAKMPFKMHSSDSATISGIGVTKGDLKLTYSVYVTKDEEEIALLLTKNN